MGTSVDSTNAGAGIFGGVCVVVYLAIIIFYLAAFWKIYAKAGKPGWAAIIPIYSTFVELEIVGRPLWWFILLLIPFVDIVVLIIIMNDLSKSFGHGVGFTLGLIFLGFIFIPILAFGSSRYVGPAARMPAQPTFAPR